VISPMYDAKLGVMDIEKKLEMIDGLFKDGYRANSEEITRILASFSEEGQYLEFFLRRIGDGLSPLNMIGAQSLLGFSGKHFFARLNIWFPDRRRGLVAGIVDRYFSIGVLHNHSFDFFTVGLLGPGYKSSYYRSGYCDGEIVVGDHFPLIFDRNLQLECGMAMFVEKWNAFHIQYYPDRLSVSLNLIPKTMDDVAVVRNCQVILSEPEHMIERVVLDKSTSSGSY
jgi:hypothetical protein